MPERIRDADDFARRGDALYERAVKPNVTVADEGKFVAVDVDSGSYEVDVDELAAVDRLLARRPDAALWLTRVGSRYAHRFGLGQGRGAA